MLQIHGENDGSAEYFAAKTFAQIAVAKYPKIENDQSLLLHIFPSVQCYGQAPQDIDLLILFADYRKQKPENYKHSFCVAVEVKNHSASNVKFKGSKCFVMYRGKEREVTNKSEQQKYSVSNYIKKMAIKSEFHLSTT